MYKHIYHENTCRTLIQQNSTSWALPILGEMHFSLVRERISLWSLAIFSEVLIPFLSPDSLMLRSNHKTDFCLTWILHLLVEWWFPLDATHSCFLALAVRVSLNFKCLWLHNFFPESCFYLYHFLSKSINIHIIQWPLAVKHLNQAILQ